MAMKALTHLALSSPSYYNSLDIGSGKSAAQRRIVGV